MRRCMMLALGMIVAAAAAAAWGQTDEPVPAPAEARVQTPPPAPAPARDPGPFAKGRKRVGLYAGAGSNFGNNYAIVGAGLGYYVADGLEAGLDYEAWIGNDPSVQKLTPQLRYVFWQGANFKPYLGGFWRHTWLGGGWPDYDSWGGRLGVAYRSGGNYLAVGIVHERYLDNDNIDFDGDSDTYPEVSVWFSF